MTVPLPEYLEELLAGYALGDLSPEEAEDLQQILLEHPELEAEAQILQEVLATLPYALPVVQPSFQVRQNILAALDNPAVASCRENPVDSQENPTTKFNIFKPKQKWLRISSPWVKLIGGIAAGIAVAIALDSYRIRQQVVAMQRQINGQKSLIAMLQQPNTRLVSLKGMDPTVTASGNIVVTPGEAQAVLILQNLAPLPDGQAYQLWSIVNGQRVPWEQFRVDQRGNVFAKLDLPENFPMSRLAITVEVFPPPPTPTGPMVMISDL